MRAYAGWLFILACADLWGPVHGPALAADAPSILIAVPKSEVTVGDSMVVSCRVSAPEGTRVSQPVYADADSVLELEKPTVSEVRSNSGIIRNYGYVAYALSADTLKVGPFRVSWTTASGDSGTSVSNVVVIPVKSVVAPADTSLKPSRDPLAVASKGIPPWLIPAIIAILAALAIWYTLTRKKKPPIAVPLPPRPIDEIEEFEKIRSLGLRESGQVKELYLHVSSAMRGFMHRNMGFDALYETTEEIKQALARTPFESGVKDSIGRIFDEADMVKFAKYLPPEDLSATIIDRAITPVRTVLDQKALERERARLAEEERKKHGPASPARETADSQSPGGGER